MTQRYEMFVARPAPQPPMQYYRYIVEGPDDAINGTYQCFFTDADHEVTPESGPTPAFNLADPTQPFSYARLLDATDTRPSDYVVDDGGNVISGG